MHALCSPSEWRRWPYLGSSGGYPCFFLLATVSMRNLFAWT